MKHILVTNPQPHCERLVQLLEARGCSVTRLPLLEIIAPSDGGDALCAACARLAEYHWVAFTSQFAVEVVDKCLIELRAGWPKGNVSIAAVGSSTAEALREIGLEPRCVAEKESGTGLTEAMREFSVKGKKVLLPQSKIARPDLARGLISLGARVDVVEAYAVQPTSVDSARWIASHRDSAFDAVIFTSPSAVEHFVELFGSRLPAAPFSCTRWYAIGSTTAAAMEKLDLVPVQMPSEPKFGALAALF